MTDQEAALALHGRLIGRNGACPICERDDWRMEILSLPIVPAPRSIREFATEGEILRTCRACGYRQRFAIAPIAASSAA